MYINDACNPSVMVSATDLGYLGDLLREYFRELSVAVDSVGLFG